MPRHIPQRRVVLLSLASATALLIIPQFSQGQAAAEDATQDEEAAQGGTGGATATPKLAVLTVVVTGDDEPVGEAEVTVTFPAAIGGEAKLRTDTGGEATFESRESGVAKVRVIHEGWVSSLQEVSLKLGSQRLTIALERL
jgi:hypothetical protein